MMKRGKNKINKKNIILLITVIVLLIIFVCLMIFYSGKKERGEGLGTVGIFRIDPMTGINLAESCNESELKRVWDGIFYESSENVSADLSLVDGDCEFYLYKNNSINEAWLLYNVGQDSFNAVYFNSGQDFLENIGDRNIGSMIGDYLDNLSDRDIIDNLAASVEFSSRFRIMGDNWTLEEGGVYFFQNHSIGYNYSRDILGTVNKNKTLDLFGFSIVPAIEFNENIGEIILTKNSSWIGVLDLNDYFSSELALNYQIINLSGANINFSIENISLLKAMPRLNFTGNESFKIIGFNDTNYKESNVFSVNVFDLYCIDSDNGINYSVFGNVRNSSEYREDECINNSYIREYYCNNHNIGSAVFNCSAGYSCADGRCRLNIVSNNSAPVFNSLNCGAIMFNSNNNYSLNLSSCFTDFDLDSLSFRYVNNNTHILITRTGNILKISSIANWAGTGYFHIYANDSKNETRGSVLYSVIFVTTTPNPPVNQSFQIINPYPAPNKLSYFADENLTFAIDNDLTSVESIEWYLDGQLARLNENSLELEQLDAGNHTVEVRIKKAGEIKTKLWNVSVIDNEKARVFLFNPGMVLFIVIIVVIVIVIALVIILLLFKKRKEDVIG